MNHRKINTYLWCSFVLAAKLLVSNPAIAQEYTENSLTRTADTLEEVNETTRKKIEKVMEETNTIQEAIDKQEDNLAEKITEQIPQQEIRQARRIYDTIDTIIDFFSGLSFDDFFGDINLNDILGDIFDKIGIGGSNSTEEGAGNQGGATGSIAGSSSIEAGEIGLPDPERVAESIKTKKTSPAEELLGAKTGGGGSVVIKDDLRTLFQVNLAKEVAEASALTDKAQEKLKKKTEAATEALKKSAELAQDSESQDVTQNIMRNISAQQWLQQQTISILAMNAQTEQRDDAIANTLMAESLRELNGERVAKNRELASAYSAAITHGAQFTLPGLAIKP